MGEDARRYTDKEFALILRRAAELQDRPGVTPPEEGGLTLAEITSIAREVGLDPSSVSRAASEVEASRVGVSWLFGGSARHRLDASVPGPISSDGYPRVIEAIRRATERHGEAKEGVGSLEWRDSDGITQLHVSVIPGPRDTHVVLFADRSSGQAVTWLLSIVGSLMAVGITGAIVEPSTALGGIGLGVGVLSAGLVTARTLWASATRRFGARLEGVLERLRSELEAGDAPPPG